MKIHQTHDEKDARIHYPNFDKKYQTVQQEITRIKPSLPTYCVRPGAIKRAAKWFLNNFKCNEFASEVLYSVKSNPDDNVLRHLYDAGIRHFDVASLEEVRIIGRLFGESVKMYFMHPIKPREAIYEAYFKFGIRDFSLDSLEELQKIKEVTNNAKDLGLHVRLTISNSYAAIDLSGKFGILPSESEALLKAARCTAIRLGICFHVGSQCMEPTEFRNALTVTKETIERVGIKVDVIDVGGGFPSSYPGMTPPNMMAYMDEIFDTVRKMNLAKDCVLWCEPGRAISAEASSLVVRVDAKKNNMLYINDGTYGGLFDAGSLGFVYHTQAIRVNGREPLSSELEPFGFYGPTCDSIDVMKGPFYLPINISEGDYIEIGQLGAYSRTIRTDFNGFSDDLQIEVSDNPLVSMYEDPQEEEKLIA